MMRPLNSFTKRILVATIALHFVAALAIAAQENTNNSEAWSGILVSSACNADEAFMEIPDCYKDQPGAKLSLLDDTTRVMYEVDPQGPVAAHLGDAVTVRGILNGDVIQKAVVGPMSIGLAVGQKAPAFSIPDQFGHMQTLDTLKGPKGTILLFFRSADW